MTDGREAANITFAGVSSEAVVGEVGAGYGLMGTIVDSAMLAICAACESTKSLLYRAVQMHGGMGMTEELAVGFYVKRLMIANTLFGDADYQQQRFAQLVTA